MFVMPPALGLPVLTGFALLCGSLPFSLWVGRWLAGRDVRVASDHNPGATNALRVGGWRVGLVAFTLDISKGALPVGLAQYVFAYNGLPLPTVHYNSPPPHYSVASTSHMTNFGCLPAFDRPPPGC